MTQEDKQLLLKDLCTRIQYRTFVCLNPGAYNKPEKCLLTGIDDEQVYLNVDSDPFEIDYIKPYLRPMSSMTEDEKADYYFYCETVWDSAEESYYHYDTFKSIDWLNAHHFDYRGLIARGLALEAPKDMYKTE